MTQTDFTGTWKFSYWYPSNDHEGEDVSEYTGNLVQMGNELVFETRQSDKGGDYLFSRLMLSGNLADNLATGTWYEKSASSGSFEGMEYSGAGQLLFDDATRTFRGMWAGIGLDRSTNKPEIYTGRWEIERIGD